MHVLFDGFWWVRGPAANRTVMREFVRGWRRAFPRDRMTIAIRKKDFAEAKLPHGVEMVTTRLAPQAVANVVELSLIQRRLKAELVIAHNYTPIVRSATVFIHDLLFEEHPEWFTAKERLYFWPMSKLARKACAVATSSITEAERIEKLHPGLAPVSAIGLSVPTQLASALPKRPAGLPEVDGFHLSVGRLNRRKNLRIVIEGAMQSSSVTPRRPLVIVGSAEYSGAAAELPSSVKVHVGDRRLVFLGRVSDGELSWLYQHGDTLLFLSRDEGYGLPPVEATHFGLPVIVSDIAVMREIVPGASAYVDPDASTDLAVAIDSTLKAEPAGFVSPVDVSDYWDDCVRRLRAASLKGMERVECTR